MRKKTVPRKKSSDDGFFGASRESDWVRPGNRRFESWNSRPVISTTNGHYQREEKPSEEIGC